MSNGSRLRAPSHYEIPLVGALVRANVVRGAVTGVGLITALAGVAELAGLFVGVRAASGGRGGAVRRARATRPGSLLARRPGAVVIDGLARRPDGGRYKQEQESP